MKNVLRILLILILMFVFVGCNNTDGPQGDPQEKDPGKEQENKDPVEPEPVEPKKYTITYELDGGTATGLVNEFTEDEKVTLVNPTKDGYNFLGWYEGTELVTSIENKNYNLTAKWEKIMYTITYDLNGGVAEELVESFEEYNTVILTTPTKENQVFVGWYEGDTLVERITENRNYDLKAVWKDLVPEEIQIIIEKDYDNIYIDDKVKVSFKVLPEGVDQEVTYKVSPRLHGFLEDGIFTCDRGGDYEISVTSAANGIKAKLTISVVDYYNPYNFLDLLINDYVVAKKVTSFQSNHNTDTYVLGSAVNFLFQDLVIIENMIPEGQSINRPGKISSSGNPFKLRYVCVHDVGFTGTAQVTSNNCVKNTSETSWHFSIGNDGVYQQLPLNEIGYHAGDGTGTALTFTDSGVKAPKGDDTPAVITVNQTSGYFEVNGIETTIKAPLNSSANRIVHNDEICYTGINNYVDPDTGTYWIGLTHWDKTYKTLANYGGNLNSVGIETSVYEGSDLFYTWQLTAKTIGQKILVPNSLLPRDVKQHNSFSGKDCPMTMRHANMWEEFMKLVVCEYNYAKNFKGWTLEFSSTSPYFNEKGKVVDLPEVETEVSYTIHFSNGSDFDFTQEYKVTLPAKSVITY